MKERPPISIATVVHRVSINVAAFLDTARDIAFIDRMNASASSVVFANYSHALHPSVATA
jgi:hypothetical protein